MTSQSNFTEVGDPPLDLGNLGPPSSRYIYLRSIKSISTIVSHLQESEKAFTNDWRYTLGDVGRRDYPS